MLRRQRIAIAMVSVLLSVAGTAQAGWPLGRFGIGRHIQPELPAPRIIDVSSYAGVPLAAPLQGNGPYGGQATARRAYPWGHFGARTRPGIVWHSGYHGEVSHWWQ